MARQAVSKRPQVLVVGDEPAIADTLAQILSQKGYSAITAYDGRSAIEVALRNPPRLVISDVRMPGMNGIELGVRVRRMFPDCKVILFSGQSDTGSLLRAAFSARNQFAFLEKPVSPTVLLKHVAESLN